MMVKQTRITDDQAAAFALAVYARNRMLEGEAFQHPGDGFDPDEWIAAHELALTYARGERKRGEDQDPRFVVHKIMDNMRAHREPAN